MTRGRERRRVINSASASSAGSAARCTPILLLQESERGLEGLGAVPAHLSASTLPLALPSPRRRAVAGVAVALAQALLDEVPDDA